MPDLASRRGYHHGHLREALIEAARRLTAERGPHGFTLAEAARLAGVSASAPYRHFKDREALLEELARQGFQAFGARLGAVGGLEGMGAAYLAFSRDEPGYYGAMFDGRVAAPRPDDGFEALVAALVAARPDLPRERARLLSLQVWALSHGIAGLERAGLLPAAPAPERVLAEAVAALMRAG